MGRAPATERMLVDKSGDPIDRIFGGEYELGIEAYGTKVGEDGKEKQIRLIHGAAAHAADIADEREYKLLYMPEFDDGARRYVDAGPHPEFSTPEETDALRAAYQGLHGMIVMARLYGPDGLTGHIRDQENKLFPITNLGLVANTCDASGNTWGKHHNVLAPRELPFGELASPLITHHATRIVWSGAGHVQVDYRTGGFRYELSEKASHIWDDIGSWTTRSRPLVNTRDEPEADAKRFRRLHDVSGENTLMPFVEALEYVSESTILRAVELGIKFDEFDLENPVKAIREISADPTLKRLVKLRNGKEMTAIQIQRGMATKAIETAGKAHYLTPQERQWGANWLSLLDLLETNPEKARRIVAWAAKQYQIEGILEKLPGLSTEQVTARAQQIAFEYHRLSPKEGSALKALRRGEFESSPSEQILDEGLGLGNTRARGRTIITAAFAHDELYIFNWGIVASLRTNKKLKMPDPYKTYEKEAEAFIKNELRHAKIFGGTAEYVASDR